MMTNGWLVLTAGLMLAVSPVHAGDASAGKAKSEGCAVCHGESGKDDPAIAGMDEAKFIKEMKAFQSGERKNKKMMKAAISLSDADLADLAAYYATLK
jgi:cytochrome c553